MYSIQLSALGHHGFVRQIPHEVNHDLWTLCRLLCALRCPREGGHVSPHSSTPNSSTPNRSTPAFSSNGRPELKDSIAAKSQHLNYGESNGNVTEALSSNAQDSVDKDEDDEIDYDAIEAEFAAQEEAESRREEEHRRKKEAEREARRKVDEAEDAAYEERMGELERAVEGERARDEKETSGIAVVSQDRGVKGLSAEVVMQSRSPFVRTPRLMDLELIINGLKTPCHP